MSDQVDMSNADDELISVSDEPVVNPDTTITDEAPVVEPAPAVVETEVPDDLKRKQFTPVKGNPRDLVGALFNTYLDVDGRTELYENIAVLLKARLDKGELSKEEVSEALVMWRSAIEMAELPLYHHGEYNRVFDREGADFVHGVRGPSGNKVMMIRPGFLPSKESDILAGEAVTQFLASRSGTGVPISVPLWHSGFRIRFGLFSERSLLNLTAMLKQNKLFLGRMTQGASFSGDDVFLVATIVNFILDNVAETSIPTSKKQQLLDRILVTDINGLMAAALASIYPRGYPVYHMCSNASCTHKVTPVVRELGDFNPDDMLNFDAMWLCDKNNLTTEDIGALSVKPSIKDTLSFEDVAKYQERVQGRLQAKTTPFKLDLDNLKVTIHCKVPTIGEYINVANRWVNTMVELVDKVLATDQLVSEDQQVQRREEMLTEYASTMEIGKHLHWVKHIELHSEEDDKTWRIIDPTTIAETMDQWSRLDNFVDDFGTYIQRYKEDMTFAMTGFNNYICPSCGNGQVGNGAKYPSIIPVNMTSYFFTLTEWRSLTRHLTRQ